MIVPASSPLRACGRFQIAFPLLIAALSMIAFFASTDISHACAEAKKTPAHTSAAVSAVLASFGNGMSIAATRGVSVAGVPVAVVSKTPAPSGCCGAPLGQCCGDACSTGCCAACAPAALAPNDDGTPVVMARAYAEHQRPRLFYSIPSLAFRPPRTIA